MLILPFTGAGAVHSPEVVPYVANAVTFDGTTTYLESALSGIVDSKKLTFSCFLYMPSTLSSGARVLNAFEGSFPGINIYTPGAGRIAIQGSRNGGEVDLNVRSSAGYDDDAWHHVIGSFDLSDTGKRHLYMDDVSDLAVVTTFADQIMNLTAMNTDCAVGAQAPSYDSLWEGDMADLYFVSDQYYDLSVEATRREFINADGTPATRNSDGSGATTAAADIWLSGTTAAWHTNKGAAGGFTEAGALTTSTNLPVDAI